MYKVSFLHHYSQSKNTIFSAVPEPVLVLTENPAGRHIEGTNLTLTCSFNITEPDIQTLTFNWYSSTSGAITQNTTRVTLTPPTQQTAGVFVTTLSIIPLTSDEDNQTEYTCGFTMLTTSNTALSFSVNDSLTLTVEGIRLDN